MTYNFLHPNELKQVHSLPGEQQSEPPEISAGHTYGDMFHLSQYCGFPKPPYRPIPFEWQHGWVPTFLPWPTECLVGTDGLSFLRKRTHLQLVARQNQANELGQAGYTKVAAIGLPFTYVEHQNFTRVEKSRLFVLEHNTFQDADREYDTKRKIDTIVNFSEDKEPFMLIHGADLNLEIMRYAKNRNVRLILGANNSDSKSLMRIRQIFETFEFIHTDYIGSHVLYGVLSGAKIEFIKTNSHALSKESVPSRKFFYNSPDAQVAHDLTRKLSASPEILNRFMTQNNLYNSDGAKVEAGLDNHPSPEKLRRLLGWHVSAPKLVINLTRTAASNTWLLKHGINRISSYLSKK